MKLHKPNNKKLNELRSRSSEEVPKAIRDVYNDAIPKFNISKDDSCQHVQKGVSMKSCSRSFQLIGEETPAVADNIYANDTCFDPYSNFQ